MRDWRIGDDGTTRKALQNLETMVQQERRSAGLDKPQGVKHDGGKDPWHLLPTDALRAVVRVLAFGAGKYGDRNWEAGMAWSRCYAALLRHLTAWWERDPADEGTGYSHLWHAGCCILFLIAYELRGIGQDDRP